MRRLENTAAALERAVEEQGALGEEQDKVGWRVKLLFEAEIYRSQATEAKHGGGTVWRGGDD